MPDVNAGATRETVEAEGDNSRSMRDTAPVSKPGRDGAAFARSSRALDVALGRRAGCAASTA